MANAQERRAAQRRLAKQVKTGTYKPSGAGAKARRAASFIGPIPERDRDKVIDVKMHGWWDTGESLSDFRKEGTIESVLSYARELDEAGVPDNLLNITPGSTPGRYFIYAARDSG